MINAMNHALALTRAGDVDNGITGRVRAWFMADQAFAGDVGTILSQAVFSTKRGKIGLLGSHLLHAIRGRLEGWLRSALH